MNTCSECSSGGFGGSMQAGPGARTLPSAGRTTKIMEADLHEQHSRLVRWGYRVLTSSAGSGFNNNALGQSNFKFKHIFET
jgi:hypothetical protein